MALLFSPSLFDFPALPHYHFPPTRKYV
uniref:Uncharacterized protein n=1 Tax=Anguilla anguilla TaxID=7936 RepID=A0A0E9QL34_ANGAN